nr:MAG TPA: hypothetical protein [Caudoviricetes sp.]
MKQLKIKSKEEFQKQLSSKYYAFVCGDAKVHTSWYGIQFCEKILISKDLRKELNLPKHLLLFDTTKQVKDFVLHNLEFLDLDLGQESVDIYNTMMIALSNAKDVFLQVDAQLMRKYTDWKNSSYKSNKILLPWKLIMGNWRYMNEYLKTINQEYSNLLNK